MPTWRLQRFCKSLRKQADELLRNGNQIPKGIQAQWDEYID
jgi:hypothetical protein